MFSMRIRRDHEPMTQSSKFVFAAKVKTAKVFGLAIPPGLPAIAGEVIE
jgi:hypothetical protein